MQLVAYGAQDIYLTGNPQITFFKVVYRRHTNFSMESIQQTLDGYNDANTNGQFTSTISRKGDLIHKCYFQTSGRRTTNNTNNFGSAWIDTIILEIGGQQIDKVTGQWMEVWAELTEPNCIGRVGKLLGDQEGAETIWDVYTTKFQKMSGYGGLNITSLSQGTVESTFIPLPFWFCRNIGLSLPLIALQYHEVKLIMNHNIARNDIKLYVDYIYLDTDERRRFAQVSHEYLIEQLQYQSMNNKNQRLNFNHPVKELVWVSTSGTLGNTDDVVPLNSSSLVENDWSLKLNGHDRFEARPGLYFTRQQIYDYHTGYGSIDLFENGSGLDSIFVYSFALKPEEHQPSGTCNFSRIDSAILICNGYTNENVTIYAVNYNVLRIMSGMGGLAYSN